MAYADSGILTATASKLEGTWIHDVSDPEHTALQLVYSSGQRSKSVDLGGTQIPLVGRQFPMIEFGAMESASMDVTATVPVDEDHDDGVRSLREVARLRSTICYRDGRGELMFGAVTSMSISDDRIGSTVKFKVEANNYKEGA